MLDDPTLALAADVLQRYRARTLTIATAESCTGGLVAASLTHHAGSSDVVLGGFVTYCNDLKHRSLAVPAELLQRHGAVSAAVAQAMAEGALSATRASCTVAVTGIAGPGGGSPDKPVGLVWFGIAFAGQATTTHRRMFPGDRADVRAQATAHALGLLLARAS
ncbi:CinA family protein [Lichenicoccus sp.]|uniref:CinA family protein n=1 Tax=Lichenicoccus sp. TaxID=2781899 RepID=UPI003D14CE67